MIDISIPFTLWVIALSVQIYRIGIKNKHQKNKIPKIILSSMVFEVIYPYEFGKFLYNKYRARKLPADFLLFK